MSSTALLKRFGIDVELTPTPSLENIHVLRSKPQVDLSEDQSPVTDAEWDKFEADINEAFEQVPSALH